MTLQTEFEFTLPKGYVDGVGDLHRRGVMRLAMVRDEVEPLGDPRVRENDAYLPVIVLSRVVERIGSITQVTPAEIEGLFTGDLAYLRELYQIVNFAGVEELAAFRIEHGEIGADDAVEPSPFGRRGGFVEEIGGAE